MTGTINGDMGLRERKKEQTRRTIENAAFRLFAQRGFQATTVADIAAAADIAPRTFFAYFRSKEDVVFSDLMLSFMGLEERLDGRPTQETTFEALRAWIAEVVALVDTEADEERGLVRQRLMCESDALVAHQRHVLGRFEALIARSVAADLGDEPSDLRPRMVAAAAVAALLALRPPGPEGHAKPTGEEALARIDDAFAFLRGGIVALQGRRALAGP
jgi:AcrR family transcriptional regulator